MPFTLLDCFCGMGGVSDGFALEGFDVTGIDIEDAPTKLRYKHQFIQADMMTLDGGDFTGYDVVWGSPPCRDFTRLPDHATWKSGRKMRWKNPKNVHRGLVLVHAFLGFVNEAEPKIWIMENVKELVPLLFLKPSMNGSTTSLGKKHVFYGNFPLFLFPSAKRDIPTTHFAGKLRSWERAKIPLPCSQAFARACKEALS